MNNYETNKTNIIVVDPILKCEAADSKNVIVGHQDDNYTEEHRYTQDR
jgi:hypothetical protein